MRDKHHDDLRFGNFLQARGLRRLVSGGWEVLHHAGRESTCERSLGSLFPVLLQVV